MNRQPKSNGPSPKKAKPAGAASPGNETCRYQTRPCSQPAIKNYRFCLKHILEDKNAPYKPCGYAYPVNNKRCLLPAPRTDKRDIGYCAHHMWKTQLRRQRSISKHVPPPTPEALLSTLSHYVRPVRVDGDSEEINNSIRTKPIEPFVEADLAKVNSSRTAILEYASESDSDVDAATMETVYKGPNEDSSDAESIDSQMDDPLKHAGIYSQEEILVMSRNRLVRLQMLYTRQLDRLTHVLREKRRRYLHAIKKERETLCPIADQPRTTAKEQKLYEKLKALNRYHKRSSAEKVAHIASLEKRAKATGVGQKPPSYSKCMFTEGGVRCCKCTIPLSRFCFKHILEDPNQTLFRSCGCEKADSFCQDTVTGLCSGETCILHVKFPHAQSSYSESFIRLETEADKMLNKALDECELDASATESAISTDNRDSPDESVNPPEEAPLPPDSSRLYSLKSDFPEEDQREDLSQPEEVRLQDNQITTSPVESTI